MDSVQNRAFCVPRLHVPGGANALALAGAAAGTAAAGVLGGLWAYGYNITPFIPGFYEYVMTDPETRKDPRMAELFTGIIYGMGGLMREVSGQDGGLMKDRQCGA